MVPETKSSGSIGESHSWTAARSNNESLNAPTLSRIPDSYYDEQSKTTKSMPPKEKMAYASSKQQLRAALSEISFQEQFMAAEASDIAYDDGLSFSISYIPY